MATILVVDDSEIERRIVVSILRMPPAMDTVEAVDGQDALEKIRASTPDLVLTDNLMPRLNGLMLIDNLRVEFPGLPIILMTAHGNDDLVVEALRRGATSYVSKLNLARKLRRTVSEVLDVARKDYQQQLAFTCLVHTESEYVLPNDPALVHSLIVYLQTEFLRFELGDANDGVHFSLALYEALVNAMYHGNLEMDSELRQFNEADYWQMANERRNAPEYRDRRVYLTVRLNRSEGVYRVRDEGNGFDPDSVPNPIEMENLDKPSGRGLLLIRTFMDEVRHNETGNEITMIFRKRPENRFQDDR